MIRAFAFELLIPSVFGIIAGLFTQKLFGAPLHKLVAIGISLVLALILSLLLSMSGLPTLLDLKRGLIIFAFTMMFNLATQLKL